MVEGLDAIEVMFRQSFRIFSELPGASALEVEGAEGVFTGLPLTFFNGIAYARIDSDSAERVVGRVIDEFRSRRQPFRWWVTAQSQPAGLEEILVRSGMRCAFPSTAMTVPLATMPAEAAPASLRIERAVDRAAMAQWAGVIVTVFERSDSEGAVWVDAFEKLGLTGRWAHFVGYADGTPAATATVLLSGDLAGIYHVATLSEFRGRRYASAVTHHALAFARDRGARLGVLQSTPVAVDVYRSIGFRDHGPLQLFDWRPEYDHE